MVKCSYVTNETIVAFVNGAPQGILWHDKDNWTMCVSPYMVVNADRFTKHYYAGSQRIASKIGTGDFNNLYDAAKACVTAGQKDYAERLNQITQSRNDYYATLGIPPGPPTAKGIYGEAEYRGEYGDYMLAPLGNYDVPDNWPMKPYKRPYGGTPGPPVMYEKPSNPEDEGAGYGFKSAGIKEKNVYFYHSDHLGSTTYITDMDGNATQFVSYKPYGEALVDEHATSFETPWKFNGKELDSETGLYYYGARYYEPTLALWYGVDVMTERHPDASPYIYCFNQPVSRIDYLGKDTTIYVFDQADRPLDNGIKGGTYTAEIYVDKDGVLAGPYSGSSYPNSISNKNNKTKYNTLSEGKHSYNNKHGHKGGTPKGLNIDDSNNGSRSTSGLNPDGEEVAMFYVNVHSGYSDNGNCSSRGSHGCITINPSETDAFFQIFLFEGNTGNAHGDIFIYRGVSEESISAKEQLNLCIPQKYIPDNSLKNDNTRVVLSKMIP